jgi:DNA-binding NarL/FixJ family response regulator
MSLPVTIVVSSATRMGCQLLSDAITRYAPDCQVVAMATSVEEVIAASSSGPDVVLLSQHLADGHLTGFQALRKIFDLPNTVRVVMLMDSCEKESVVMAFRGGARGVFVCNNSLESLYKCIHAVNQGQIWANSSELTFLLESVAKPLPKRAMNRLTAVPLTKREEQISLLVTQGLTNREISRKLYLSEHTVKNYLFRIFDKLGISTRVELTIYLYETAKVPPVSASEDERILKKA